jgi:hypothetical protein
LLAQVGVNNPNPQQALDVNGKVKIGNDGRTPTAGTLRYNQFEDEFQGYTNEGWEALGPDTDGGASPPTGVRAGVIYEFGALANSLWTEPDQVVQLTPTRNSFIPQVRPAGEYFIVDRIYISGNSLSANHRFRAGIREANNIGGGINPQLFFTGSIDGGTVTVESNRAPLLVIRPGNQLQMFNDALSQTSVRIVVHGFYVTDLDDYFNY